MPFMSSLASTICGRSLAGGGGEPEGPGAAAANEEGEDFAMIEEEGERSGGPAAFLGERLSWKNLIKAVKLAEDSGSLQCAAPAGAANGPFFSLPSSSLPPLPPRGAQPEAATAGAAPDGGKLPKSTDRDQIEGAGGGAQTVGGAASEEHLLAPDGAPTGDPEAPKCASIRRRIRVAAARARKTVKKKKTVKTVGMAVTSLCPEQKTTTVPPAAPAAASAAAPELTLPVVFEELQRSRAMCQQLLGVISSMSSTERPAPPAAAAPPDLSWKLQVLQLELGSLRTIFYRRMLMMFGLLGSSLLVAAALWVALEIGYVKARLSDVSGNMQEAEARWRQSHAALAEDVRQYRDYSMAEHRELLQLMPSERSSGCVIC
ncbi:hypothetical protein VaNZ11_011811 [Volvox africanus]|uniref:Uncharacterized protein n=1 Tax=Volvox africanus TaxID=51714 RepID=A0ABQ5SCC0_9CHLO|nr:hypothetical protein VaNZ11_011811 [Volvox africanus]